MVERVQDATLNDTFIGEETIVGGNVIDKGVNR